MKTRVIVLGGGPAGYSSALSCAKAGMEVILVEQNAVGGTCVHHGCIPTRAYLSAIKAREQLVQSTPSLASILSLCAHELRETTEKKIDQLSLGMEYIVQRRKVQLYRGRGEICGEKQVRLPDDTVLDCDALVLATGSEEKLLAGHGFVHLHHIEELLSLRDLPETITIVGAGVLGVELAVILSALGCAVTLTEREPRILPGWDGDIARCMAAWMAGRGITIRTGVEEVSGEHGVFCIGRKPQLPIVAEGITLAADWLYPVGDVCGRGMTADKAIEEGERVAAQILAGTKTSLFAQAHAIFTPLEAASVGEICGPGLVEGEIELSSTPMGVLAGSEYGFVKAVMDKDSHILRGFHIVSPTASESIQVGQMAVHTRMCAEDFTEMIFPHPTEGELLKLAVQALLCG